MLNMYDVLMMARTAANDAGAAGRDKVATVIALVVMSERALPEDPPYHIADLRARALARIIDAFYEEGAAEVADDDPYDYDLDTPLCDWVVEQRQHAAREAEIRRGRLEYIARN